MKKTVKIFAASACFFLALVCFTVTATYAWFIDRGVEGSFAVAAVKVEAVTGEGENEVVTELGIYTLNTVEDNKNLGQVLVTVTAGNKIRFTNYTASSLNCWLLYSDGPVNLLLEPATYENGDPTGGITQVELTDDISGYMFVLL